jgi:hypothetical protein
VRFKISFFLLSFFFVVYALPVTGPAFVDVAVSKLSAGGELQEAPVLDLVGGSRATATPEWHPPLLVNLVPTPFGALTRQASLWATPVSLKITRFARLDLTQPRAPPVLPLA